MTPLSPALDVESEGHEFPAASRSTSRRNLRRAAAVVGLLPTVPAHPEKVGDVTGLPGGSLFFASRRLAASTDTRLWRAEVSAVFADLIRGSGHALMDRLAVLGHIAGLWGPPYRWWESRAMLRALGEPLWRPSPAPI